MMHATKRRIAALMVFAALTSVATAEAIETKLLGGVGSNVQASGDPGDGGASLSLAAMWPFHPGLETGVMVFAEDIGNSVGNLRDPNDPSLRLGSVQEAQRTVFGGGWRVDAMMGEGSWKPFATATLGYYRVERDQLGNKLTSESAVGASIGIGLRRVIASFSNLGLAVRYHQLSSDELKRYVQVTLEGSVRWGQ